MGYWITLGPPKASERSEYQDHVNPLTLVLLWTLKRLKQSLHGSNPPQSKEVQSFVSFVNFYRRFINKLHNLQLHRENLEELVGQDCAAKERFSVRKAPTRIYGSDERLEVPAKWNPDHSIQKRLEAFLDQNFEVRQKLERARRYRSADPISDIRKRAVEILNRMNLSEWTEKALKGEH
ncbi:hypothetical protein KEM56_000641 [Ascosphaera pollenicola]|nr:hypothetical protein KEM56_000641 [Ascosphaera pollenicola]